MRLPLRLVALLLLAVGTVGAGVALGAPTGYAAGTASLTANPRSGAPDAQFTVAYRWTEIRRKHSEQQGCFPNQIAFEWDGEPLGRAAATLTDGACVATLRATPPRGTYRGTSTHTITVVGDRSARITYTVGDAAPATSGPEAGFSPEAPASDAAAAPGEVDATARAGSEQSGSGGPGVLIAFGVILTLVGAGTVGFILWRMRHPKSDLDEPDPDQAALLEETRPMSLGYPAGQSGAHRAP